MSFPVRPVATTIPPGDQIGVTSPRPTWSESAAKLPRPRFNSPGFRFQPVGNIAFCIFLFVLAETVSRFHEVLAGFLGGRAYIFTPSIIAALIAIFLSGRIPAAWDTIPGKLLLAFTVWMLAGTPFSIWRGGTVQMLKDTWATSLITFMLAGAMVSDLKQMRRVMFTVAGSMLFVLALYPKYAGIGRDGRLIYPNIGSFANPNDFALHILFGLPFLMFVFVERRNWFTRLLIIVASVCLLTMVLKTGSRGAMIGILALALTLFIYSSVINKLKFLVAVPVVMVLLFSFAGEKLKERFQSSFSSENQSQAMVSEAAASMSERKELLLESLRQTLLHPVFGVGAANFPVAYAAVTEARGSYKRYLETHNAYTKISSETGIPGVILYCSVVVWCFRKSLRVFRWAKANGQRELTNMSFYLFVCLLTYSVTVFFGTSGYRAYVPLLAGLILSLSRIAEQTVSGESAGLRSVPVIKPSPARFAGNGKPFLAANEVQQKPASRSALSRLKGRVRNG